MARHQVGPQTVSTFKLVGPHLNQTSTVEGTKRDAIEQACGLLANSEAEEWQDDDGNTVVGEAGSDTVTIIEVN